MKDEYIKIPVPTSEKLDGILTHPDTKFMWSGTALLIANPKFRPMCAEFSEIEFTPVKTKKPEPSKRPSTGHGGKGGGK